MKKLWLSIFLSLSFAFPALAGALQIQVNTAKVISFGPFVNPTDGVTLVTSLVSAIDHASTGIFLSKNGGALTIRHASVTASTYDAYGNYRVTLDATDTNTVGTLRVQFAAAASCLPVFMDLQVVGAAAYDRNITGNVAIISDVWEYATRGLTAATNITSSGNAIGVGSDDKALISATGMSELTGVPSATPTPEQAWMILYMALRNKLTVTATQKSIYNDAGTLVVKKTLGSAGGTFTESEAVDGP